jgi:hypothetical protein
MAKLIGVQPFHAQTFVGSATTAATRRAMSRRTSRWRWSGRTSGRRSASIWNGLIARPPARGVAMHSLPIFVRLTGAP